MTETTTDTPAAGPIFSVVVPCYNEAENLAELHRRLVVTMTRLGSWEAIYINDGSTDGTLTALRSLREVDRRVVIVNLSRNFGKEIATTAGLDHARGEAIVLIDADLQDPPELIAELEAGWRQGYDNVYAQRRSRAGETWLKRSTAAAFYRLFGRVGGAPLPQNVGDFRLMSRRFVDALLSLREQHRFMKGLFAWVGMPSLAVPYDRAPRFAGRTKWNYWKLWNLALEGITSFTVLPLKVATYLGLAASTLSLFYGTVIVFKTIFFGNPVAGYPSLATIVLFLGGVQLIVLGVIGEYLGRIFNESKQRPLYIIDYVIPAQANSKIQRQSKEGQYQGPLL